MTVEPVQYEFVIVGRLGERTARALGAVDVVDGTAAQTRLRGWMNDQTALHGVLERIRDLGLELVDVRRLP